MLKFGFLNSVNLWPKEVVNVNFGGMQKVCICNHHQKVKLLAMSSITMDYKIFSKRHYICHFNLRNHMLLVCKNCLGLQSVRSFISNCFIEDDIDTDEERT